MFVILFNFYFLFMSLFLSFNSGLFCAVDDVDKSSKETVGLGGLVAKKQKVETDISKLHGFAVKKTKWSKNFKIDKSSIDFSPWYEKHAAELVPVMDALDISSATTKNLVVGGVSFLLINDQVAVATDIVDFNVHFFSGWNADGFFGDVSRNPNATSVLMNMKKNSQKLQEENTEYKNLNFDGIKTDYFSDPKIMPSYLADSFFRRNRVGMNIPTNWQKTLEESFKAKWSRSLLETETETETESKDNTKDDPVQNLKECVSRRDINTFEHSEQNLLFFLRNIEEILVDRLDGLRGENITNMFIHCISYRDVCQRCLTSFVRECEAGNFFFNEFKQKLYAKKILDLEQAKKLKLFFIVGSFKEHIPAKVDKKLYSSRVDFPGMVDSIQIDRDISVFKIAMR